MNGFNVLVICVSKPKPKPVMSQSQGNEIQGQPIANSCGKTKFS